MADIQLRSLEPQIAYAEIIPHVSFKDDATSSIDFWAARYSVNADEIRNTLQCESHLNPSAVGDHGTSFGIAQIHLPAHTGITKQRALDPDFSIQWMASQFATSSSMWTCARLMGYL